MNEKILSKKNVVKSYNNLTSNDPMIKNQSNQYLMDFYKYEESINISIELIDDKEIQHKLLGAISLLNILRYHVLTICKDSNKLQYYNNVVMQSLLKLYKTSSERVVELLCCSFSIIMNVGIFLNISKISDIIEFTKSVDNFELCTLLILGNIPEELNRIRDVTEVDYQLYYIISEKLKSEIINIKNLILDTISKYLTSNPNIVKYALKVLCLWQEFNLSVIHNEDIGEMLLCSVFPIYSKEVSEVFTISIERHEDSRLYENNSYDNVNELLEQLNSKSLNFICKIINACSKIIGDSINNKDNSNSSNVDRKKMIIGISEIIAVITQNFGFMLFLKNEYAMKLMEMTMMFTLDKSRLITSKFSECFGCMRELICKKYIINDYDNNDLNNLYQFLLKAYKSIFEKCLLKDITIIPKIKSVNTNPNEQGLTSTEYFYLEENIEDDIEISSNEISIGEFRRNAEDFFYNIFFMISEITQNKGQAIFFNELNDTLNTCNSQLQANPNDSENVSICIRIFENVLFVMRSIFDLIELFADSRPEIILEYNTVLNNILDSNICNADRVVYSIFLYVDKCASTFKLNSSLAFKVVRFLLITSNIKLYEVIASSLILNICEFLTEPNRDIIELLGGYYFENYNKLCNNSVWNIAKSLSCWGNALEESIKKNVKITYSEEEFYLLYKNIIEISISSNTNLLNESVNNNIDLRKNNDAKRLIIKNYHCESLVLKESYFLSKQTFSKLFNDFFIKEVENIKFYVNIFKQDDFILDYPIETLVKSVKNLSNDTSIYFSIINEIIVSLLMENPNCIKAYECLKFLWINSSIENSNQEVSYFISGNFKELTNLFFANILKLQNSNSRKKVFEFYCQMFVGISNNGIFTNIDLECIMKVINIVNDFLRQLDYEDSTTKLIISFYLSILKGNLINNDIKINIYEKLVLDTISCIPWVSAVNLNDVSII